MRERERDNITSVRERDNITSVREREGQHYISEREKDNITSVRERDNITSVRERDNIPLVILRSGLLLRREGLPWNCLLSLPSPSHFSPTFPQLVLRVLVREKSSELPL